MAYSRNALRVLGALVEKDRTTPEYYPLSLNALTNACNQKSNRDPVLALTEDDVGRALSELRAAGLALQSAGGGRVVKYAHNLNGKLQLEPGPVALLTELLLRGPQTPGELRARAERMHHFADVSQVESALAELAEHHPPLVTRLPRQPGRKESRYAQLMGGPPAAGELAHDDVTNDDVTNDDVTDDVTNRGTAHHDVTNDDSTTHERLANLESEMRELKAEMRALWKELRSLTMQPDPE